MSIYVSANLDIQRTHNFSIVVSVERILINYVKNILVLTPISWIDARYADINQKTQHLMGYIVLKKFLMKIIVCKIIYLNE